MQAAFFDLDKTVIAKSSTLAFSRSLYREGLVNGITLLRSVYGQLVYMLVGADEQKMEKARKLALKLTEGWEQAKIRRLVNETMEDAIRPLIYSEALELFAEHRRNNRRIYIVSSAPEEVVGPLARMLGADDYVATRAEVVDGRYTGELDFYCYGPYKADALREIAGWRGYDLDECYAYSDSITDLPMLAVVGHPTAVNPDRELQKEAEERGWEISEFRDAVALEPKIPLPPAKSGLAIAGVAAGVAAGVGIAYLKKRRNVA